MRCGSWEVGVMTKLTSAFAGVVTVVVSLIEDADLSRYSPQELREARTALLWSQQQLADAMKKFDSAMEGGATTHGR